MTTADVRSTRAEPEPNLHRRQASAGLIMAVVAALPVAYAAWVIFGDGPEFFELTATQMMFASMTSGALGGVAIGLGIVGFRTWQGWIAMILGGLVMIGCGLGVMAVGAAILIGGMNAGL